MTGIFTPAYSVSKRTGSDGLVISALWPSRQASMVARQLGLSLNRAADLALAGEGIGQQVDVAGVGSASTPVG
jgi:hypothetical protein